ncbi:GNAT family N-acetyltransferase [Kriegella aquimaris]|uniref:Phosphinothricin acetyltransferase n=1 Tax=Kriegella aquimaris TaxID=192904 RepID=A0A1G9IC02_9FLAO|nr:GNAT family N-acetyltransferase [Kriegella aquimaris]SDL22747.1 phosphinothricin acetyltransferase [Kriegella aquimaris]
MTIETLDRSALTPIIGQQIRSLFNQLNSDINQLVIDKVLVPDNTIVFAICKEDDIIIGMAAMATYKVISGHKGMIEDVVVSTDHRGKGIGKKLMQKLLKEGKKQQLNEILLFSGHHRLPAIALYKSLGFQLKNSGLYTLKVG